MKNMEQLRKTSELQLSYDESIDWNEFLDAERLATLLLRNMVEVIGTPRNQSLIEELERREQFIRQFR